VLRIKRELEFQIQQAASHTKVIEQRRIQHTEYLELVRFRLFAGQYDVACWLSGWFRFVFVGVPTCAGTEKRHLAESCGPLAKRSRSAAAEATEGNRRRPGIAKAAHPTGTHAVQGADRFSRMQAEA
jgi:hypothetical protein